MWGWEIRKSEVLRETGAGRFKASGFAARYDDRPQRQPSHVWLPNRSLSVAKKCHLDAGRAQKLITAERNVWLSSPVTRWSWWADKGSAKWFLPFLRLSWLAKVWDPTSAAASPQPLILEEQDLEEYGDEPLVPRSIQVIFHQDGGHFLTKNKRSNEALNPLTPALLHYLHLLRLNYLSASCER